MSHFSADILLRYHPSYLGRKVASIYGPNFYIFDGEFPSLLLGGKGPSLYGPHCSINSGLFPYLLFGGSLPQFMVHNSPLIMVWYHPYYLGRQEG